jgi:hypothetical protein
MTNIVLAIKCVFCLPGSAPAPAFPPIPDMRGNSETVIFLFLFFFNIENG